MAVAITQPPAKVMTQAEKLFEHFEQNDGKLLLHKELLNIVGIDTRQELYQLVNDLRKVWLANIKKVYAEGYIYYKGSDNETQTLQ